MTDRYGLTEQEREAIANHARRRSAYLSLKTLVNRWQAELALQDKADRLVARVCGGMGAFFSLAAAAYLIYRLGRQVADFAAAPAYAARMSLWYLAAVAVLFSSFYAGLSYATWSARPRLKKASMWALPIAAVLFFVGLIVAPLFASR